VDETADQLHRFITMIIVFQQRLERLSLAAVHPKVRMHQT
jgi:hypothetical protein